MVFRLIVGLGNPTFSYEKTRHNAGFWFVDEIASRNAVRFSQDAKTHSLLAKVDGYDETIWLLKPMQYMNKSGSAVRLLSNFYKIPPAQILVVHDDLDFDPGVVRIKVGGGHGGHNGLRDIVAMLGSGDFARVRLGIGRPSSHDDVANYVLGQPSKNDAALIDNAINRVADNFPKLLAGNLNAAMNALHQSKN